MKLLVILILVGQEVSEGSTVSSKAEKTKTDRITSLNNNTENEKPEDKRDTIDKRHVHPPVDEIAKTRLQRVISEEIFEKPKRERETDKDFLKNVIREILSYDKYKHLVLRDSNSRKKRLHFGIQIGYNENESASATDEKVPVDSVSEELTYDGVRSVLPKARKRQKTNQRHYVPGRSKGASKQAEQEKDTYNFYSYKDNVIELAKILKKYDKNNKNIEEGLSHMAMALTKYLQYSKINENDKNFGDSKGSPINKEADIETENLVKAEVNKDLVNRIISEIKLLLAAHKDKSNLYVSRILDIITKNQEFLISHPNQDCGEAKIKYLIHTINTVYQKYLKNAECEGEYLDTGLDLIGWISSNKKYVKSKRELDLKKLSEIDSNGENESNSVSNGKRYQSSSDYSSGEVRMSDSLENKRLKKVKHIKRLLTSDDSVNQMSKEFESDEDHQDPNKEVVDLYIKSRLLRPSRSAIFHRSHPYYKNIEKLFKRQENTNIVLDSIRLVCEKIASEQFLHSIKAIIWKLLKNRDCKSENALTDENHNINEIKPLTMDITKHQIEQKAVDAYSFEESSEHDISDLHDSSNPSNEESSLIHKTEFAKNSQNDEDSYSDYDAVPLKFKQFVIPISKINLRSKLMLFRNLTHLRNDQLASIFGSGKINSLKVIKQKLKDLNINDYKKLMENLPVAEKLLKIIYSTLPPQLQTVLKFLKTSAMEMMQDKKISAKKIPYLLVEAFLKGKGKDLSKMMADKFEHEKSKKFGKLSEKFQDKTRLRDIVRSVSELADNKISDSNVIVDKDQLQEKPEPSQLDTLPHIELSSSIEKTDQPIVELTYVFNHPPVIHYKPKFFVKHNITYDQYLKNIKSIYNNDLITTGNQIQLVRVIKKEGNNSQVFYETDIPNAAVEASNKSALLKLYEQFYSTENNDKISSSVEKVHEHYETDKKQINEIKKSIPPAAEDKHPTVSTVSSLVSLKDTTEFQSRDEKSEVTVDSTSKNNEFSLKHNESRSEEVFFDNDKSAEVDNMEKPKPQSSSDVHIGREGLIQWNNYPINKPKYNKRRKISQNHQKNERPEN